MGGSEFYQMMDQVGLNVPRVYRVEFLPQYRALHQAIKSELVSSCHAVARGGLAVNLALAAMGGALGMSVRLPLIPSAPGLSNTQRLYSESCGRFVITVAPEMKMPFEKCFPGMKLAEVGTVTESPEFVITGETDETVLKENIHHLKASWKKPFGDLI
jgi:phosphoribosylformylglycinamidine (FGAM) synthase-like enzyme